VRPATVPATAGVRNTVGFDFHPDTGKLYFTDNGRDSERCAARAAVLRMFVAGAHAA
jgi:hypothetical protein